MAENTEAGLNAMELDTFNSQLLMPDAHNFFDIAVFGLSPGSHFQAIGQTCLINDQ